MKRTLIVIPHLDDETFGIGGTLFKMCNEDPSKVRVLALCKGRNYKNSVERKKAFHIIQEHLEFGYTVLDHYDMELENVLLRDLTHVISSEIYKFNPERVITVSGNDIHQDHQITSHAVQIVVRPGKTPVNELLEFQIPGSEPFTSTYFDTVSDVSDVSLAKQRMLSYYTSENQPDLIQQERFKTVYRKFEI